MSGETSPRPFTEGQECPVCGEGVLKLEASATDFNYKGHHKTVPVEQFVCSDCDSTFVDDVGAAGVEPELRLWRRSIDGLLMPEEIRQIRRQLGVTQRQMAEVVGGGAKAFAKYETGAVNQSQGMDLLLRTIGSHPRTFFLRARERGVRLALEPVTLLLVWKNPETRGRCTIGVLTRGDGVYRFRYELTQPRSMVEAVAQGFSALAPFPDIHAEYVAHSLWSSFAKRVPSSDDIASFERFDLVPEQDLEYLRATGGRMDSDSLEFLEPLGERAGGEYSVTFPIAGWRYYEGERVVDRLEQGTELRLELEPENRADRNAVRIVHAGVKLGYVPAIYAWYIDEAVAAGEYRASVQRIGEPDDPQIRVVVALQAKVKSAVQPLRLPSLVTRYGELLTV